MARALIVADKLQKGQEDTFASKEKLLVVWYRASRRSPLIRFDVVPGSTRAHLSIHIAWDIRADIHTGINGGASRTNEAFGPGHPAIRGLGRGIHLERLWLGVDMLVLQVYLPQEPEALWHSLRWRSREHKGLRLRYGSYKRDGFVFRLCRYPSPLEGRRAEAGEVPASLSDKAPRSGYDLTIRFNPATVTQQNNAVVESPLHLLASLQQLRLICQQLGLGFDPATIAIGEIHLARDVWFTASDPQVEEKLEQEVSDYLRVFEWGHPRRVRDVRDYRGPYAAEELSRNDMVRGTKKWNWTLYDKTREQQAKGIPRRVFCRRTLRLEWRLKSREHIQQALGLSTGEALLRCLAL